MTSEIGVKIPSVLLPKEKIDHQKWAVIACDQFTSEPEYWEHVRNFIGDSPSTYHMILPEVWLGTTEEKNRIETTHQVMVQYLESDIFRSIDDFIYVHRRINGKTRRGLMVSLDLEKYDYNKGAQTLIRATEGTILDRLPPRICIREKAPLECPHILVLFDDPNDTVFGLLDEQLENFKKIYDFELMLGSGYLTGYALGKEEVREKVLCALHNLINPETFANKYKLRLGEYEPLLFAMGDGNHSLATAKSIWEKIKTQVGMDHPARYALVEIENVHDPALSFEPIHWLIFRVNKNIIEAMNDFWGDKLHIKDVNSSETLFKIINDPEELWHQIGMISPEGYKLIKIHEPEDNLPVGTLQKFLDIFLESGGAEDIDYVHGTKVLIEKGMELGNAGFYLPGMDKSDLFKTVILDGALPRKTFSMGEAKEKRFYMECRRIKS